MSDRRTLSEKLRAMAEHPRSDPNEAAVAASKLQAMGASPPPPERPTAVGAMGFDAGHGTSRTVSSITVNGHTFVMTDETFTFTLDLSGTGSW